MFFLELLGISTFYRWVDNRSLSQDTAVKLGTYRLRTGNFNIFYFYSCMCTDAGQSPRLPRAVDVGPRSHPGGRSEGTLQGPEGLVLRSATVEVRTNHSIQEFC